MIPCWQEENISWVNGQRQSDLIQPGGALDAFFQQEMQIAPDDRGNFSVERRVDFQPAGVLN